MNVTINDYDLRKAIELDKKILSFSGLYPLEKHAKRSLMQIIKAFVNLSLLIAAILSMLAQIIVYRNDMIKVLEALMIVLSELTYFSKLANLTYYGQEILKLEQSLTNPLFYGFPREQLAKLQDKVKACARIAFFFKFISAVCVVFFGLVPFVDKSKKMELPLPGWLPYDAKNKHYYYPTVLCQVLAIYTGALNNVTIDTLIWMFITLATAQFELLKEKLKNIDFDRDRKEELRNCVEHHNAIVLLVSNIERNFSKCVFVQFLASGLVICSTCFQVLFIPVISTNFVYVISYLSAMTCQVAMYCWYGHDIMITSSELGMFFYMSNWYESDVETRKIMLVFLERFKRPAILTAGNFIALSLVTLTSILRSSYSFFAVLRRLYQDK